MISFFRHSNKYIDFNEIKKKIIACKESGKCIEILFPLFSRKPISPIKNCGNYADIAEIYTILKIAAFVKIARNFLGKNIIFTILSDGKNIAELVKLQIIL